MRKALLDAGIEQKDISTDSFDAESIQPYEYEPRYRPKGKPYFQVTNSLLVKTKSSNNIGKLIDIAMKTGATSIDSVNYRFDNPAREQAKALGLAVKDAKIRAQAAAEAGGVRLREISNVVQDGIGKDTNYNYPLNACKAVAQYEARKDGAQTYSSPKEESISSDVIVTFAIER